MKTNGTHEVIARIAGPGLVLAALFALVLSGSSVVRAQSRATSPPAPAAAPAKAAPAAQVAHPATPAKGQPGGTHEGIKVHGHWMIEVRSPDGKLLSHTEFENSFYGTNLPVQFLNQTFTPGEWGILLGDPSTPPCSANFAYPFNINNPGLANQVEYNGPFCVITQLAPPAAIYPINCGSGASSGCSSNLQVGSNISPAQGILTLSGKVTSETAGTISVVQTVISTCGPTVGPSACWKETSPDSYSNADIVETFTGTPLPSSNTPTTPCGGTGQISCAVNVPAAGDTINVQVTISFQ
jgi:hypothetical protein